MFSEQFRWWQSGIIYQIYPRSFKDSNGDGVGDLAGIIEKLDYLSWLGVNAIWLSPFYPSPQADFGYDVSNYTDVDPLYGNLADFDKLVKEAHARGIKVIIDLVPNHTSDEHPWFQEARSGRDNPKRDWYIWRDPGPDGEPPNNWLSYFGNSAWEFEPETGQYYLHLFHIKQPDLNWRNPQVRQAIYEVMHFWFRRGVDGFRIDVLPCLLKDELLRDNPLNPEWKESDPSWVRHFNLYTEDLPEIHEIVREMRQQAEQYPDRVLIGEIYLPYPRLMRYYGEMLDEIHLPFNFGMLSLSEWAAAKVREKIEEYEAILPESAWPNWVLGNHDRDRIASRIGKERAGLAQMLLLTLRGTPTCYYGDELAMQNVFIPPHLRRDTLEENLPGVSRDPERTPMQWSREPNAGFCLPEVTPWLPVSEDFKQYNVESERQNPASLLYLVQRLIQLRAANPALHQGSYRSLTDVPENCLVYLREFQDQSFLVVLNFSGESQNLFLTGMGKGCLALSTRLERNEMLLDLTNLAVAGFEGLLVELERPLAI